MFFPRWIPLAKGDRSLDNSGCFAQGWDTMEEPKDFWPNSLSGLRGEVCRSSSCVQTIWWRQKSLYWRGLGQVRIIGEWKENVALFLSGFSWEVGLSYQLLSSTCNFQTAESKSCYMQDKTLWLKCLSKIKCFAPLPFFCWEKSKLNYFSLFLFQLLTAMFFQKFSVSAPEGKEVKEDVVDNSIINVPKPFEVMVTKRQR